MSQHAVETKRGHRTHTIEFDQGANKPAQVYSSTILNDKRSNDCSEDPVPTSTDEPMCLDALNALDQLATNYINDSKALKAAPTLSSQGSEIYISRNHPSALWCIAPFLDFVPIHDY